MWLMGTLLLLSCLVYLIFRIVNILFVDETQSVGYTVSLKEEKQKRKKKSKIKKNKKKIFCTSRVKEFCVVVVVVEKKKNKKEIGLLINALSYRVT